METVLIERSRAGDGDAFARLYGLRAAAVKAYFLRAGFAEADADDLVQGVFVRMHTSLGTFDAARGSFGQWLAAIARNVARRAWEKRRQPDHFDPELAEETLAAPDDPAEAPAAREETQAVRRAVEELPADLALLVRLRYVEGRTTRGVAAAAGLPESTVRLRLDEARARLGDLLRAQGIVD
jgi:RNA polymerase sigma-70 factor (ECF subfamily)